MLAEPNNAPARRYSPQSTGSMPWQKSAYDNRAAMRADTEQRARIALRAACDGSHTARVRRRWRERSACAVWAAAATPWTRSQQLRTAEAVSPSRAKRFQSGRRRRYAQRLQSAHSRLQRDVERAEGVVRCSCASTASLQRSAAKLAVPLCALNADSCPGWSGKSGVGASDVNKAVQCSAVPRRRAADGAPRAGHA